MNLSSYKDEGKAPMELLNPDFLRETAKALEVGEKKHAEHHYLTHPVPLSKVIGATIRHLMQLLEENIDEGTGIYHTGLAAANLQIIDIYLKEPVKYGQCDDRRFKPSNPDMGFISDTTTELQKFINKTGYGGDSGVSTDSK